METEQLLRIKSAMIVYSLEKTLGNYIVNMEGDISHLSDKIILPIVEREKTKGVFIEKSNVTFLLEASYLDEVFNLAIDITDGTSYGPYMKSLKDLCASLNIFEIRNAISHPNRTFLDTYWFRAAAIASDPLIILLGLGEVRQALNSALAESLNPPPDDWIYNVKWAIPNSLPTAFDHEITGLLGRDKEFKDLESSLSKVRNNLIAVVAPGGVGKTALILQFLKDISLNPQWSDRIDAIIFCTLKNERLTAEGIEIIEAINGIDQVKTSILEDLLVIYPDLELISFADACTKLENEKILVCIDNLETLLVNSQEEFIEFNQSLPLYWRVIVTSRISVDSATTVPLQSLSKRPAVNLCRSYFKKRGIHDFKLEDLELIAQRANNNPLAIRLTVDLYIKGVDISQSINQSQKDIAAYSYTNLIESLRPYSISILEAIYVTGESTKTQLIDLLDLSNDDISESINELSKTSLIVRSTSDTGNDLFNLSDSIRDLLLTNPKNIEVRSRISDSLKERKIKIQEQIKRNQILGITVFDEEYISDNVDSTIHVLIVDLNKYLAKPKQKKLHTELIALKNRFGDLIAYNTSNHELFFHYSRILRALKDFSSELQIIMQALKIDENNPRYLKAMALNYFFNSSYQEANVLFEDLISKGYESPEVSSKYFSASLVKLNLLCLLYLGEYNKILTKTINWQNDLNWSILKGTYRASAFKRSGEFVKDSNQERETLYQNVFDIFNEIFHNGDYPILACVEINKILKEFSVILIHKEKYSSRLLLSYIEFIATHYFNIISVLKDDSIDSKENSMFLAKVYALKFDGNVNPLHKARWYVPEKEVHYDNEHIEELKEDGYEIVKVYHIPDSNWGMPKYLFAKNANDKQFYLHVDNFDFGWNKWGYIKVNDKLAIKYEEVVQTGATNVTEIVSIDRYEI